MDSFDFSRFEALLAADSLDEALKMADHAIGCADGTAPALLARIYFERGKLHWKTGNRAEAIADYNRATELDQSSPAAEALKITRRIMNFYHRDLYNP